MADEKAKSQTEATGPGDTTAPVQPEQKGAPAPEQQQPVKTDAPVSQEAPASQEKQADTPAEKKAASVSVYNFNEIMSEKKGKAKAAEAPAQEPKATTDKKAPAAEQQTEGKETPKEAAEPPKRRGRPPKEGKEKADTSAEKASAAPKEKAQQKAEQPKKEPKKPEKAAPAGKADKTAKAEKAPKAPKPEKAAPEVKAPVQPAVTPPAPAEAPSPGKDEQIVYLKLSDLHAFKNHPFQVRNDEEMKAMVSSIKDKGVTQPAIVRPREDGGYEIVSGHRRQKASELAGFMDMPCIVRDLTDEQAITQMVEDNTNQRENILPSERAKALKMQLEAIKHQGARDATSGQVGPEDAGRRSNEIVAERNKMTVKQVQRFIKLNDLVPDLQKMMDEGQIKFTPAVELSYIKPKNQRYIAVAIESQQSAPSLAQSQRMRELDQKGILNGDVIDGIMMEDKKEVDKVILTGAELGKYFGKETTPREMKDQIVKLLDDWKSQQKEQAKPEKKAPEAEK
ncbi:ParB/RepB/Spo0J family partition protein [Robinsoniella peoriensis]|uniref:ParB/RepB/Spo0J family partition protein n=1 Tax=Robinsoniella peoriensis TaxID=180332 RepID=UPI00085BAEF1|nr:ParB/RepB/Spo0J family partition protein [Robinsoniella peoriensis]